MARGINKVIIVGVLGADPETKYTAGGTAITNISLATSESWKDKQTGQQQERTEWHKVVFFGKLAEISGQYLKKGSKVYIEGKLRTNSWEKDGVKHYSTSIEANEMQMLDSKGDNQQAQPQQQQAQPQQQQAQPQQRQANQSNSQGFKSSGEQYGNQQPQQQQVQNSDFDQDIPF